MSGESTRASERLGKGAREGSLSYLKHEGVKMKKQTAKRDTGFARIMAAILYSESVQHSKSARLADAIALANLKGTSQKQKRRSKR